MVGARVLKSSRPADCHLHEDPPLSRFPMEPRRARRGSLAHIAGQWLPSPPPAGSWRGSLAVHQHANWRAPRSTRSRPCGNRNIERAGIADLERRRRPRARHSSGWPRCRPGGAHPRSRPSPPTVRPPAPARACRPAFRRPPCTSVRDPVRTCPGSTPRIARARGPSIPCMPAGGEDQRLPGRSRSPSVSRMIRIDERNLVAVAHRGQRPEQVRRQQWSPFR